MKLQSDSFCHSFNIWFTLSLIDLYFLSFPYYSLWSSVFGFFFFFLLLQLLFFLFLSLFKTFNIFGIVRRDCFMSLSFQFFNSRVFYRATFTFRSDKMSWLDTLRIILVYLISNKARLKCILNLSINCFYIASSKLSNLRL